MKKFVVCTMGGLVDSFWDNKQKKISPKRHTIMLDVLNRNFKFSSRVLHPICMKDGRDVDVFDFQKLHNVIKNYSHDYIVVVAGLLVLADIYDYLLTNGLFYNKVLLWGTDTLWREENHVQSLHYAINKLKHNEDNSIFIVYEQQYYSSAQFRSLLFTQNIAL